MCVGGPPFPQVYCSAVRVRADQQPALPLLTPLLLHTVSAFCSHGHGFCLEPLADALSMYGSMPQAVPLLERCLHMAVQAAAPIFQGVCLGEERVGLSVVCLKS